MQRLLCSCVLVLVVGALLGAPPTRALAKGRARPILDLQRVIVDVLVEGEVVTTTIEQTWHNPGRVRREIDVILPIPADAAITEYRMDVEGEALRAELLPRPIAKRVYVETVRRMQDPALLKRAGDAAVRARAFPVEAGKTRRIKLSYKQVMATRDGVLRHAVLPAPDRPEHDRIGSLDVRVRVAPGTPVSAVYSPTHALTMQRTAAGGARASHVTQRARAGKEVLLFVARSKQDFGLRVLTHVRPGEPGWFLLLGSPRATEGKTSKSAKRTVLFVIDRSGSMKGRKIEQVQAALRYCVQSLQPTEHFNLLTFSDEVESLFPKPAAADADAVARALAHTGAIVAEGGTNIGAALQQAVDQIPSGMPADIVFLTDGLPTVGEEDPVKLRAAVGARNEGRARLFTFGVGDDVNATLLDGLALDARGFPSVVRPTESVEVVVSSFFKGITAPALQDLSLRGSGGIEPFDVQPRVLPDLFHGNSLAILGRFRGKLPGKLVLRGTRDGTTMDLPIAALPSAQPADNAYLPALWAARKIGHLIDDIRAKGPEPELVDQVVTLAMRHGIVTEYTAFLLDLDTRDAAEIRRRATEAFREGGAAWRGAWAQSQLRGKEMMKRARVLGRTGGFHDREGRWVDLSSRVERIGGLVFLQRKDGTWVDSRVRADRHATTVAVGSERYRALIDGSDLFARVAGLGAPILLRWEGRDLHIVEAPAGR